MKKRFVVVAMLLMLLLSLAGCNKVECDLCGEMKNCKTYENLLFGEMNVCTDCSDAIPSWTD